MCKTEMPFTEKSIDLSVKTVKQMMARMTCGPTFQCIFHEKKQIDYYNHEVNQMMCQLCVFEKKIDDKNGEVCQQSHITNHAEFLLEKINLRRAKLEENANQLKEIIDRVNILKGDKIIKSFEYSHDLLIPFYSDNEEIGYKIRKYTKYSKM